MVSKHVRTVELQLLRHGPPHNQLLSPLTDYLALCGDHPNTTLNFPLEHLSLVVRLRALRYQDSEETRKTQLHETAQMVANMFASVPGLISELGRRDSKSESLVHLSIATTASELSLVPFELSTSPPGFPGSGASFCLQTEFPVCITRRSRQVRFKELQWDTDVRILLVASDPLDLELPLSDHVDLLRKFVTPLSLPRILDKENTEAKITSKINSALKEDANPKTRRLDRKLDYVEKLTILLSATAEGISRTIRQAIADQKPFSHIHILAHGSELPNQPESSGVALHLEPKGLTDVVDGLRLGQLLTANRTEQDGPQNAAPLQDQGYHPLVVTVAVCDSGRASSDVAKPGSSVGFHIHEARIPFVVCSQFPLTKPGSVIFTDGFYSRLLDGIDPRICLWEARRELFSQQSERKTSVDSRDVPSNRGRGRHDWASIIAFASLPPSIEQQTLRFQRSLRRKRMESKLDAGDKLWRPSERPTPDDLEKEFVELTRNEVTKFDHFVDQRIFDSQEHTRLLGISASANKRLAEFLYANDEQQDEWLRHIRKSCKRYLLISRRDANCGWAFVQRLFLNWFLALYQSSSQPNSNKTLLLNGKEPALRNEWLKAAFLCHESVDGLNSKYQIWHLTDKLELGLLCWLIFPFDYPPEVENEGNQNMWDLNVMLHDLQVIDRLALAGSVTEKFAAYSGRRQLLRYRRFANMFYVKESAQDKSSRNPQRRSLDSWGSGYTALSKKFTGFAKVYEEVERVIQAQIEFDV